MSRRMPDLAGELSERFDSSLRLPESLEQLRSGFRLGSREASLLHQSRLDAAYEAAYLRIFVAWEDFLESTFVRFLCGYTTATHHVASLLVAKPSDLTAATSVMLTGQAYFLWHNPIRVIKRSKLLFTLGRHETVFLSAQSRLEHFGAVRHRIAHGQADAMSKFDTATMTLCGKRYRGSNPASFLRDWDISASPNARWIEIIAKELHALAVQITA